MLFLFVPLKLLLMICHKVVLIEKNIYKEESENLLFVKSSKYI